MEVRVLGPVTLWHAGREVPVARSHRRCVLAVLAMVPGRPVSQDTLIDRVWGTHPPRSARHSLYTHVSGVRRLLDGLGGGDARGGLRRRGGGYSLEIDPRQVDLHLARQYAEQARTAAGGNRARDERALALLRAACALWRGTPLAGLTCEWAAKVRTGLQQEHLALSLERFTVELRLGGHAAAVGPLSELATDHPLVEPLVRLHMLALYRCGRQAEALQAYTRARTRLVDELGDEPGADLRALHQQILRRDPAIDLLPVTSPAARSLPPSRRQVPAQLPPDVTAFTGREPELSRLDALLPDRVDQPPAVVISAVDGGAGVGKTALAVHWAHRVADRFPDGQVYANLRGYAPEPPLPPIEVLSRFLHALGTPDGQAPADPDEAAALYRSLTAGKRILVLLDNASSPMQVRPLLAGGPGSMVLVTSRDRLDGLVAGDGAHRLAVHELAPAEAHVLLTRIVGADRTGAEPAATAEVARLCGYLPLALRIAAANLTARPHRPITDYLAQLSERNRLAELTVPGDPQRTVPAAFDLSYTRLPAAAQRMFQLLGLLPGADIVGEAAAALADTSLEEAGRQLEVLAGAHLVEEHARGRYTCHDLLRCYAAGLVAREETGSARHAARVRLYEYYLRHTDAAARLLYPSIVRLPQPASAQTAAADPGLDDAAGAREWLDTERDNLVAAIRDADPDMYPWVWQLADNLRGYFWLRTPASWLSTATAGLAAAEAAGDRRAQAAGNLSLALFHQRRGDLHEATRHSTRTLELAEAAGWVTGEAAALNALGSARLRDGSLDQAEEALTGALAKAERAGERSLVLAILGSLVMVNGQAGRLTRATAQARRALSLGHRLKSRNSVAANLCNLGEAARVRGRLDVAIDQLTESRATYRAVGNTTGESQSLCNLAATQRDAGRFQEALETVSAALDLAREAGDKPCEVECLSTLASVHLDLDRPREAADLCVEATAEARGAAARYEEAQALVVLADACRSLSDHDAGCGHAATALNITQAAGFRVIEGQALTVLAGLHLEMGNADRARDLGGQALAIHRRIGHRLGTARTHLVLARACEKAADATVHRRRAYRLLSQVRAPGAEGPAADPAEDPALVERWTGAG